MKLFIFKTFLILLFTSCGKKVTVKGRAYNALTNEGISDVSVNISREKFSLFSYDGAGSKSIESDITDSEGKYVIEYRHKTRSYRMLFTYDEDSFIALDPRQNTLSQENKEIDFPLVPITYVKYKIKNTNCIDQNDEIEIFSCSEFDLNTCNTAWGGQAGYVGCVDYESLEFGEQMAGEMYFHWIVTKNNVTTHHYDTIYLEPFQDYTYEILY